MKQESEYIKLIQANEGIIHKVIGLYADFQKDKEDLFQEILLQSWKSFKSFRAESKFSTWLYKVSLNTALSFQKSQKKHQHREISERENDIAYSQNKEESQELLYLIIKALDEVDRMLITLFLEGYKNQEIAEITGLTSNHVNVKIHRIKKKITESFTKEMYGQ